MAVSASLQRNTACCKRGDGTPRRTRRDDTNEAHLRVEDLLWADVRCSRRESENFAPTDEAGRAVISQTPRRQRDLEQSGVAFDFTLRRPLANRSGDRFYREVEHADHGFVLLNSASSRSTRSRRALLRPPATTPRR